MKRRPPQPDPRLDWRDPKMPVLREYQMPNGRKRTHVDPDYERRYREHLMQTPGDDWENDPTYNLRRKK